MSLAAAAMPNVAYLDFESPLNPVWKMPGNARSVFNFKVVAYVAYNIRARIVYAYGFQILHACMRPSLDSARCQRFEINPNARHILQTTNICFAKVLNAAHPKSSQLCTAGKVLDEIFMIGTARIRMLKMTWQRSWWMTICVGFLWCINTYICWPTFLETCIRPNFPWD